MARPHTTTSPTRRTACRLAKACLFGAALIAASPGTAAGTEAITVTVSSYVRTTPSNPEGRFKGLGVNVVGLNPGDWYEQTPAALRRRCAELFWKDLDLAVMRFWGANGMGIDHIYTAEEIYKETHRYLEDVRKVQARPPLMIYDPHSGWSSQDPNQSWSSAMTEAKLRAYIVRHADVMEDLFENYGWRMDYVEITNEPEVYLAEGGWSNPALRNKALVMTRLWREELDRRGFHSVKVLAASRANVDADALPTIAAFKNDPAALAAWGGYSFHSYGASMTRHIADALVGPGLDLEVVQTESGPPQQIGIARMISDINLGTGLWLWFQAYSWDGGVGDVQPDFDGVRLAGFVHKGTAQMDIALYPKFYFFREVARSLPIGSRVHRCGSDKPGWPDMEFPVGQQSPLAATAAERPDGRWSLLAINATDDKSYYNHPYPATVLNVTFSLPHLAAAGDQPFRARLIRPDKTELDLPPLTLRDGRLTVTGLQPGELITLHSTNVLPKP